MTAPNLSVEFGSPVTQSLHVATAAPGITPTGTVTIREGGTTLGTGTVSGGAASITLPARSLAVGSHTLSVEYSGDSNLNGATTTFSVTVSKAASTTEANVKPKHPRAGHKVKLEVTVEGAHGVMATGEVTIKVNGKKLTGTLKNGEVTVKLGTFAKGDYKAKVAYDGDANVDGSKTKVKFEVS